METLFVGWLLGILSGGVVAVIAQLLAFRYAVRLQAAERRAREAAARRALFAELRENLAAIPVEANRLPKAPIVRTAWDEARALPWRDDVFAAIAAAYAAGGVLNTVITEGQMQTWASAPARDAFARALDALQN